MQHIAEAKFPMNDPDRMSYKSSLVTLTNTELKERLAEQWELSLQPDLCTEDCVSYLQNVKDVDLEICSEWSQCVYWTQPITRPTDGLQSYFFGPVNESQITTSSSVLPVRSPGDYTINQKVF